MGLSYLGIFQTVIGIIAIVAGIISSLKKSKIDLNTGTGKIYFYGTLVSSLTALGLSSVKGVNPGHIFALLILILISIAYYLYKKKSGNKLIRIINMSPYN